MPAICSSYPLRINVFKNDAFITSLSLIDNIDDISVVSLYSLGNITVVSSDHGVYKLINGCPILYLYLTLTTTSSP